MNKSFRKLYIKNPNVSYVATNDDIPNQFYVSNDERFGGFLVPFLTGAIVSAPFWYLGGSNNAQKQMYYQSGGYPAYYPYTQGPYPQYYPYPPYK